MLVLNTIEEVREFRQKHNQEVIGLVPTMGYLHDGHASLIAQAKKSSDLVIVYIFINPLQFGANEDLSTYPRNMENDITICEKSGADVIFAPTMDEIYTTTYPPNCLVRVNKLEQHLCGAKRMGHFDGVCTIISKFFNIVLPNKAFFGRKDIQQLRIIETMVEELNFPVEIIGCDTVRSMQGLALSSRNSYLSPSELNEALVVPNMLQYIKQLIHNGETNVNKLIISGHSFVEQCSIARLDYLEIVDYVTLQPLKEIIGKVIIATAVFIGKVRLIDNIILRKEK